MSITVDRFGVGSVVYFTYTAPSDRTRRLFNLMSRQGDIILRFAARYEENVLVLNSLLGGQWAKEDRHRHFPMTPGVKMVITVLALPDGFEVSCNKRQFCVKRSYPPGYNAESVYTLSTSGDCGDAGILCGKHLYNVEPGSTAYVHGTANRDFSINLLPGYPGSCDLADYALHFNPRFSQNTVVRNAMINTKWGSEERDGGIPFSPGTIANVSLTVQQAFYEISVSGYHFTSFRHRIPFQPNMTMLVTDGMSSVTSFDYFPGR